MTKERDRFVPRGDRRFLAMTEITLAITKGRDRHVPRDDRPFLAMTEITVAMPEIALAMTDGSSR